MLRKDKALLESLTKKYGRKELVNEMSVRNFTKEEKLYYDLVDMKNDFKFNYLQELRDIGGNTYEAACCIIDCYNEIIENIQREYNFKG